MILDAYVRASPRCYDKLRASSLTTQREARKARNHGRFALYGRRVYVYVASTYTTPTSGVDHNSNGLHHSHPCGSQRLANRGKAG
jgi:hypothetical protein